MVSYVIPVCWALIAAFALVKDWRNHHKMARWALLVAIIGWLVTSEWQVSHGRENQRVMSEALQRLERQNSRLLNGNAELLKSNAALKVQNDDLQARQVQQVEQMQVLQECVANPKSGKCSEHVGAHFKREATATLSFGATATAKVVRRPNNAAHKDH